MERIVRSISSEEGSMIVRVVSIIMTLFLVISCGIGAVPIRDYCDSEVSYDLWKTRGGYRLHLRVGKVTSAQACRMYSDLPRAINLDQDVSSPEEADKLIDKYRRIYVEKTAATNNTK